jgi:uncharacterized membrane-anchored protein
MNDESKVPAVTLVFWVLKILATTLGDFATRSLGSLAVGHWATGTVSVDSLRTPRTELFYWVTIMFSQTHGTALFWAAFVLNRPLGAVLGDLLDKPVASGGLAFSRPLASAVLLAGMFACLVLFPQRAHGRVQTASG